MDKPQSLLLVVKAGHEQAWAMAQTMRDWLQARKIGVRLIAADANLEHLRAAAEGQDALLVLGGDGTVVGVCRKLASCPSPPPWLGINFGKVGFLTSVAADSWEAGLTRLVEGRLCARPRAVLAWKVRRDGEVFKCGAAFNDVLLARGSLARVLNIHVEVGETPSCHPVPGLVPQSCVFCPPSVPSPDELELWSDDEAADPLHEGFHWQDLGWHRADGMLVFTPQGSSGYAFSMRGSLVHPDLQTIGLTAICPFLSPMTSLVLPPKCRIRLETSPIPRPVSRHSSEHSPDYSETPPAAHPETEAPEKSSSHLEIFLTVDGQEGFPLRGGDAVEVRGMPGRLRQLGLPVDDYFSRLRGRGFI